MYGGCLMFWMQQTYVMLVGNCLIVVAHQNHFHQDCETWEMSNETKKHATYSDTHNEEGMIAKVMIALI